MQTDDWISLIIGVLGFASAITSILVARRKLAAERNKIKAETDLTDVDAFDKFSELLKKLQDRNDTLYQENVKLETQVTEKTRSIETLTIRLDERDKQLTAATRQLDMLRDLAKQAPVTDTLKQQLEAMNVIVVNLQAAQKEMSEVLRQREKAYDALFESTRNMELKRPKQGE